MEHQLFLEENVKVQEDFKDDMHNYDSTTDMENPDKGIEVICNPNMLEADVTMDRVPLDGLQLFGGPLGLAFSLVKTSTFYLYIHPQYFPSKIFFQGMFFYMSFKVEIKPGGMELAESSNLSVKMLNLPSQITAHNKGTHIGKTSGVWDIQVLDDSTGTELASGEVVFVSINQETRTPHALRPLLPEITEFPVAQNPPRFHQPEIPDKLFQCRRHVQEEHIDQNGHVNYRVYMGMIMSAVRQAVMEDSLGNDHEKDYTSYSNKFKDLHIVYVREMLAGENVGVKVWEKDRTQICAIICDKDETVITYCTISLLL